MTYKYQCPKGDKYTISIRKWNNTFRRRGRLLMHKAEVYLESDKATCHFVMSWFGKVTFILMIPFLYVLGTIGYGFPETHSDIKRLFFQKSYGAFTQDMVFKGTKDWDKLQYLIWEVYKDTKNPPHPARFDRAPPPPAPPPAPCNCKCGGCK